jgi:MYXO-CTERM domain-containing protein
MSRRAAVGADADHETTHEPGGGQQMVRMIGILVLIALAGFILYGLNSGDISTPTGTGAGVLLLALLALLLSATKQRR